MIPGASATALVCRGCGARADGGLPFRCPQAGSGDGADHVLAREWTGDASSFAFDDDPNPFVRYRRTLRSWAVARQAGLRDDEFVSLVRDLDRALADVDGRGFVVTPCAPSPSIAARLGLSRDGVLIKDDTGNVAGSHKARHLFGLALSMEVAKRAGDPDAADGRRPLAIASCGNAALAAAVVARAMNRSLRVFVPPWADPTVIAELERHSARIERCPRRPDDPPGDPCHHRFREAVRDGAWPFSVQGSDNALVIEGASTLGLELAEQTRERPIDRLFIQVGGGALASAVTQGLELAHAGGLLARVPAIHAVQTAGGFPLVRAWRRVARDLVGGSEGPSPRSDAISRAPSPVLPAGDDASGPDAAIQDAAAARWIASRLDIAAREAALVRAARHRALYMTPWETEPKSAASGILDDETYDWHAVVGSLLRTGGWPIAVVEPTVLEAHEAGHAADFPVSATGAASLAGGLTFVAAGLDVGPLAAFLFTGVER